MRRLLSIPALTIFFLAATTAVVVHFNINTPRLLILHSYGRDCHWAQGVDAGIRRILDDKFQYVVRWFYLDTERHPWSSYRDTISQSAHRLIDQWQPDVVLAVDDDAQQYVMKRYVGSSRIQIVFAGVSGTLDDYGYTQATNVTGIMQRRELSALRDAIASIAVAHPGVVEPARVTTKAEVVEHAKVTQNNEPPLRAEVSHATCVWNTLGSRSFLQWQGMMREVADAACDHDALARAFEENPLRLASSGRKGGFELWQVMKPESALRTEPSTPCARSVVRTEATQNPTKAEVRVISIGDKSTSARSDEALMRVFDWRPLRLVASHLVETFPEWQAVVEGAAGHADFIVVTDYRALPRSSTDPTLVAPRDVVSWTLDHAPVPVIGTNGFFVKDGGYLAVGASPYEQGEVAARMAVAIIEHGAVPTALPVVSTQEFVVFMRGNEIRERGLSLPRMYESFARATNNYFD